MDLQALSLLDTGIEHTPTVLELYTLRARVLKHKGEKDQAAAAMLEAQSLDTSDRFLASKAAKAVTHHKQKYYIVDGPNLLTLVQRQHIPYETFELKKSEKQNFRISI